MVKSFQKTLIENAINETGYYHIMLSDVNDNTVTVYLPTNQTFILPDSIVDIDGNQIDFSGKHEGGMSGSRSLDHRQINEIDVGCNPSYI